MPALLTRTSRPPSFSTVSFDDLLGLVRAEVALDRDVAVAGKSGGYFLRLGRVVAEVDRDLVAAGRECVCDGGADAA